MEGGIQEGDGRDHLAEGISTTLETIRRQIEEGSGKVETPRPPGGVEPPSPEENPAVVEDRQPDEPQS